MESLRLFAGREESRRSLLARAGSGECIDPRVIFSKKLVKKKHKKTESGVRRLEFLRTGKKRKEVQVQVDYVEKAEDPPVYFTPADVSGSIASFLISCVVYVSTAQMTLGQLDPKLVFVVVDQALLGTALALALSLTSKIPWTVPSVDVGFVPFIAQLGQQCWTLKSSWAKDGEEMYEKITREERRMFLATFVAASSLTFFAVGVVLVFVGKFKLSRIVEYFPYPVTAGLLASIGVSLLKSGARVASSAGWRLSPRLGATYFGSSVLCTVALRQSRHYMPSYYATPLLLLFAFLLRFAAFLCGYSSHDLKELGLLFRWSQSMLAESRGWIPQQHLPLIHGIDWATLVRCQGTFAAAVVVGVLKISMKTGSLGSLFPSVDVDAELVKVGIAGNIVPSLFLASGQAHSFTALKVAQRLRASPRGCGVMTSALCLVAWFFGFGLFLKQIPRFIYGALLLDVGFDYVDTYLIKPCKREDLRDSFTLGAIVLVATATSLLEAVAIGLVLSLISTASKLAAESVVTEMATAKTARSTIERNPLQTQILDSKGDDIHILALRGYIFFGSASEILDCARSIEGKYLVLDVSRCFGTFDSTAKATFHQIADIAKNKGFELLVAPESRLSIVGKTFESADDAIEYAEESLISSNYSSSPRAAARRKKTLQSDSLFVAWLDAADTFSSLSNEDEEELSGLLGPLGAERRYDAGEYVFRHGDLNDSAFLFVCFGKLRLLNPHQQCVRKLSPGNAVTVGDYYLSPEDRLPLRKHTLLAVTTPCVLLRLPYSALNSLESSHPRIALHFHKIMAGALANKNRNSMLARH